MHNRHDLNYKFHWSYSVLFSEVHSININNMSIIINIVD